MAIKDVEKLAGRQVYSYHAIATVGGRKTEGDLR